MNQHVLKPTISAEDVIGWQCCYDESRVRELLPEPQSITELLSRADVPHRHRVWLATRPGVLSEWALFNFAANCAERSMRAREVPDEHCRRAVEHMREMANDAKLDHAYAAAAAYAGADAAADDARGIERAEQVADLIRLIESTNIGGDE